jgi:UDP-N-acetylmuramoyl-L-alanyl-D-glutamate--2,6-diaminopimelate ligase
MNEKILYFLREKIIPRKIFNTLQPVYHFSMALIGAILYRFPSRKIKIIAVTGTKGKSSVTEILNFILEEANFKTALTNTIRFKIDNESSDNLYKMSMPGRMFIQRFLRKAVKRGCQVAILEMTSQGAELFRHRFIDTDALIFTNVAPEHIESHGSFENYVNAKLKIVDQLVRSKKPNKVLVVNNDDLQGHKFLERAVDTKIRYSLSNAWPYALDKRSFTMTYKNISMHAQLSGEFNVYNCLAAISYADAIGIPLETIKSAIEKFNGIPGRVEHIDCGQDFVAVVDYAHTPDSLQKLYDVFLRRKRICVLGNTGGGRDKWKRDEMAKIAENCCEEVILTNEDPYDDDPLNIITDMAKVMTKKPRVIIDRREAIAKALSLAKTGDAVLITGKGTDPYIMGPKNSKTPWSDAKVTHEEITKLLKKKEITD